jgi:hypothetical protein
MQIKRVIAGGLTALAAGATLALGAGAVTLGDFVKVSGNTMTSPYIVIGNNAAAADTLAAADVAVALAGQATTTVAVPGAQGTMSVANGALIEGEAYKLYIGTALSDSNRKPDLTKDDLPVVLAGGTVDQKTISDVDYSEYLSTGGQSVTWKKQSEWTEAALNLEFDTSTVAYTYKIVFQSGLDTGFGSGNDYIRSKEISILGKDFVFSGEETDLSNTSLVLFAAGQTETVSAGSSTTVTVAGNDYVISVVGIDTDGLTATLDINGEAYDVADLSANGDTYVTKGDLNVYIKSIRAFKFPAESGSVQLFIGSDKLTLDSSSGINEILAGDTTLDGSFVNFTQVNGDKIYEIQITYTPDDEAYLRAGESLDDGIFNAFSIAYGGVFPALDAASKDKISISKSSTTKGKLEFVNKAGSTCSMNVYYATTPAWSDGSRDIHVSQPSGDNAVSNFTQAGNITKKDFFLVSRASDFDLYILQYVSYDSTNNLIKLKDMCSGATFDASTTTKFFYLGGNKYLFDIDTASQVIRVEQGTGSAGADVSLYTAHKAGIVLSSASIGNFVVTEAPYSLAGIQGATQDVLNITTTVTTGEITSINVENTTALAGDGMVAKEDTDYKYGVTESGTYVVEGAADVDTLDIYTPDIPSPVFVAFGSAPTFSAGEGVTGGTVKQAVMIKNSISKMESEISTSSLDRDVVLLGGPCANGLVATALNMSAASGQCRADFTAMYPTEGVIKVVSDVFSSGQKALVVAGVDRTATRNLAVKVMQGTVAYSA